MNTKVLYKTKIFFSFQLIILSLSPIFFEDFVYPDNPQKADVITLPSSPSPDVGAHRDTPLRAGEKGNTQAISLNNILVNKINKEIRIKAKLAITEGILEYFLVGDQGKTYESVFKIIGNKPSELNFALLLVGCRPLNFNRFLQLTNESQGLSELFKSHKESLLEIEIFSEGKKIDIRHLMRDREGSNHPFIWVYTGGFLVKDHGYAGDLELSYIGIWPDKIAVINLFSPLKNPYQGNFGLEINKKNKKLKVDQNFEIVIRRYSS